MYRKKSNGWFKHFDFIIIDLLCVQFSYVLAYFFRHGLTNLYEVELYRNMALMIEIADLIVIFMLEQYKGVLRRGYYNELVSVLKQMIFIELISNSRPLKTGEDSMLSSDVTPNLISHS